MRTFQFRLLKANGLSDVVMVAGTRTVVGRNAGELRIDDPGISDPHLELWLFGDQLWVKPIGEVMLDGRPLREKTALQPGQVLTLGMSALELLGAALPEAKPRRAGRLFASVLVLAAFGGVGLALTRPELKLRFQQAVVAAAKKGDSGKLEHPFAWVKKHEGRLLGGVSQLRISLQPSDSRGISISFKETAAGATGNQWRAAAWLAAFNAERMTRRLDEPLSFTVQADDDVDGPSASMLMSVGFMALLRQEALLDDRIVSATVNPDGTAGPVGGLTEKIAAAQSKGLKAFGVPKAGPQPKASPGIEVTPIANLYEAYEFMTGVALPRAAAVDNDEMSLPEDFAARLSKLTVELADRADERANEIEKEAQVGPGVEMLFELSDACRNTVSKARKYQALGYAAAGYNQAVAASARCAMGSEMLGAYRSFKKGKVSAVAVERLDRRDPSSEVAKLETDLAAVSIKTLDQQLLHVDTCAQLSQIHVLVDQAAGIGKEHRSELDLVLRNLRPCRRAEPATATCLTAEALQLAFAQRALRAGALGLTDATRAFGVTLADDVARAASASRVAPLTDDDFGALAGSYTVGARAVLAYFDSLFTDELAATLGISRGLAQSKVAGADTSYLVAWSALDRAQHEVRASGQGRFAAAATAYLFGAGLVNRYLTSEGGKRIDPKEADAQLDAQLEGAKVAALEAAGRAKAALGFVPLSSRMAYLQARGFATGDRADRRDALTQYWSSALWSDLAASLDRTATAGAARSGE